MKTYKHLFFDLDQTITPARQPMLPLMRKLLEELPHDIIIVSGSLHSIIKAHTHDLPAYYLGINGNHATDNEQNDLWINPPLTDNQKQEIHDHISKLTSVIGHDLNHDWKPIEDRGQQITFSPIGNVAPVDIKMSYDPDRSRRKAWLLAHPFVSEDLVVNVGGSTSFDYYHKDYHKGANVDKLIKLKGWDKDEAIYFGDGLFPGGNDESVIGVIETMLVSDHNDTYQKLKQMFQN